MATVSEFMRSLFDNSNARFSQTYDQWLPQGLAANRERLLTFPGITDPASQMDAPVPDPLKGNMFQDIVPALGVLALPFMAAGITGALGAAGAGGTVATDTLGAIGAGTEAGGGFGAGTVTAGAGGGGGLTMSELINGTPPGSGTALQQVVGGGGGDPSPWMVNPSGSNLTYNAATGAFEPATGAAAGGGTGAGSGMVYDAATGSLVPSAAATGTAALAAGGAAGAGTEGAAAGLFGNGSGPFGLTPLQTLGAASTIGSLVQGGTALIGSKTQADAANRATDAQLSMFNTINAQGAPYRAAGYSALGQIMSPENQAYINHQFGPEDLQKGLAPGYEFMRDQGLRAARNAGNAQTGLLSGNTIKGVTDYATNYALNAGYQPAFNNYMAQRDNIFNRLNTIAGLGTTANQQSASAGSSISPGIANSIQNYGTALGGGYVGAGNALAGGLNNAASWYALPQILGRGA